MTGKLHRDKVLEKGRQTTAAAIGGLSFYSWPLTWLPVVLRIETTSSIQPTGPARSGSFLTHQLCHIHFFSSLCRTMQGVQASSTASPELAKRSACVGREEFCKQSSRPPNWEKSPIWGHLGAIILSCGIVNKVNDGSFSFN